jgi:mono/diheme cytochrome c family protein
VLVTFIACAAWLLASPSLETAGREPIPSGAADLRNGRDLFFAGSCGTCHASPGEESPFTLGGGRAIRAPIGTLYAPNISPDPQYGIGSWTASQFLRALRAGVSPDSRHYYPVFPYTSFQRMSASDVRDLFAFVNTLPTVASRPPQHDIPFPFSVRRAIGWWKLAFLDGQPFRPEPGRSRSWNRGAYLVEAALRRMPQPAQLCGRHSPRTSASLAVRTRKSRRRGSPTSPSTSEG